MKKTETAFDDWYDAQRNVVEIGEAMVGDKPYRRAFAGDTLNTCWHELDANGRNAALNAVLARGGRPHPMTRGDGFGA